MSDSVRKVLNIGDERNQGWCVHCGGEGETRDHAPSKVFLDEPFPNDLPLSPACRRCNEGFSSDEDYVAGLIECVLSGDVDPEKVQRPKIGRLLRHNQGLLVRLRKAQRLAEGQIVFDFEFGRVRRVLLKLARCHAAYELNEPQLEEPLSLQFKPFILMNSEERESFEGPTFSSLQVLPEVGSRAMHRALVYNEDAFEEGWLTVQEGRYRYRTSQDDCLRVQIVIREYLACEVI